MQVQQKLFNKIVFTLRQRKLRFPPSAAGGEHPFRSVSSSSPPRTRLRWASRRLGRQNLLLPPTKMFSTMLFYKCDLYDRALCCLAYYICISLFSFQGAIPVLRPVVENSGIEPLTS